MNETIALPLLFFSASAIAAVSPEFMPGDFSTEVLIPSSRQARTMGSRWPGIVSTYTTSSSVRLQHVLVVLERRVGPMRSRGPFQSLGIDLRYRGQVETRLVRNLPEMALRVTAAPDDADF